MKNIFKIFIVFLLLVSLVGCAKKDNKVGLLGDFDKESKNKINKILDTNVDINDGETKRKYIQFDNINTLLLALKSSKISHVIVDETTARYFAKRQTGFSYDVKDESKVIKYSLCFKEDKKDLCDNVSAIIDQLSNEGFLNIIKVIFINHIL
ncbi:MAG: transporter substrate-binding domain-containing protein [Lachnospiraceae bacterium]|nr:transporter substrate-binding domain-containing protein [Lachnospiraceae bacterium]